MCRKTVKDKESYSSGFKLLDVRSCGFKAWGQGGMKPVSGNNENVLGKPRSHAWPPLTLPRPGPKISKISKISGEATPGHSTTCSPHLGYHHWILDTPRRQDTTYNCSILLHTQGTGSSGSSAWKGSTSVNVEQSCTQNKWAGCFKESNLIRQKPTVSMRVSPCSTLKHMFDFYSEGQWRKVDACILSYPSQSVLERKTMGAEPFAVWFKQQPGQLTTSYNKIDKDFSRKNSSIQNTEIMKPFLEGLHRCILKAIRKHANWQELGQLCSEICPSRAFFHDMERLGRHQHFSPASWATTLWPYASWWHLNPKPGSDQLLCI